MSGTKSDFSNNLHSRSRERAPPLLAQRVNSRHPIALGGSRERDGFGFGEAAQKGSYATHHMNSKLTEVSLTDVSQEFQDANAMKR
jgi:hypothetical protein